MEKFYWLIFLEMHIYYTHLGHGSEFNGPQNPGHDKVPQSDFFGLLSI